MPKSRFESTVRDRQGRPATIKFKIGNRKSKKSALNMSNADLTNALTTGRPRDRGKIRQVMIMRGLPPAA